MKTLNFICRTCNTLYEFWGTPCGCGDDNFADHCLGNCHNCVDLSCENNAKYAIIAREKAL